MLGIMRYQSLTRSCFRLPSCELVPASETKKYVEIRNENTTDMSRFKNGRYLLDPKCSRNGFQHGDTQFEYNYVCLPGASSFRFLRNEGVL